MSNRQNSNRQNANRKCTPKEKMKNAEEMKANLKEAALGWFSY